MPLKINKTFKKTLWLFLVLFIMMNIVACFHAYKFTHFSNSNEAKTLDPTKLSATAKIKNILFGISNPRPQGKRKPLQQYETIKLKSNTEKECWNIPTVNSNGTVILFHGFSGDKSTLIDKSDEFIRLGYSTFLVDFMGSGGSEGNRSTIGYIEAQQVKTCFDYVKEKGESKIYLFGTSMGAAAILKAINDDSIKPEGIILECPFGTMYQTVCARFKIMKVPSFPMAGLLVFWGGVENGFWAFGHNPENYAKSVTCPTLLLYGEQDDKVSRSEINAIYDNLKGLKQLKIYPLAGHENYLDKYHEQWVTDLNDFLSDN